MTTNTASGQQLSHPVTRLTALWALNECGLGGLMFALKIPLTGFFVGGFAVLLIALIAHYSNNDYKQIVKATVLVLIAKATASPHSPPPAYLALAFQGLSGALIYRGIRHFRIASVLLAVLAMAESALQKIIILTLIYGKSIWIALDKLYEGIMKEFRLPATFSFSYLLIGIYLLVYLLWGLLAGLFAARLPEQVRSHTEQVLSYYRKDKQSSVDEITTDTPKRKCSRFLVPGILLSGIALVFIFSNQYQDYTIFYIIIRSLAAIFLLFFVLRPVATWLIQRWLRSRGAQTRKDAAAIMILMPGLRRYVKPSWRFAGTLAKRSGRLRYFILSMIILSLHEK